MPKSLLQILHEPFAKPTTRYPNQSGMTPLAGEKGVKDMLKNFPIQVHPEPYENDFTAGVKTFNRAANRYGHDNVDYNNQTPSRTLRNPTLNVATEAFIAVDAVGLGNKMDWRVVNVATSKYETRKMQREDAIELAAELNKEYIEQLDEAAKGEQERDDREQDNLSRSRRNKIRTKQDKEDKYYSWVRRAQEKVKKESLDELDEAKQSRRRPPVWDRQKNSLRPKKKNKGYGMTWDITGKPRTVKNKKAFDRIRNVGHYSKDKPYLDENESLDESVSRKHFRDVANTVRSIEDPGERQKFADHHAEIFSRQNPRFSHEKFHAAAGTKTKAERGIKTKMGEEQQFAEVAPPGREEQVKALKKKFPGNKASAFKIAWASYNKSKGEEIEPHKAKSTEPRYLADIMEAMGKKVGMAKISPAKHRKSLKRDDDRKDHKKMKVVGNNKGRGHYIQDTPTGTEKVYYK